MRKILTNERPNLKSEPKIPIIRENVIKSELLKYLKDNGILKFGDFVLKSGLTSQFYIDIKSAFGHPVAVNFIMDLIKIKLEKNDLLHNLKNVIGSGLGGHTFTSMMMLENNFFAGYDRGNPKKHGTGKIWEGKVPDKEDKTIITEDVYSSGTSVNETLESLEKEVGTSEMVEAIVVVVNRSEPIKKFHIAKDGREIPIISIFDSKDFII